MFTVTNTKVLLTSVEILYIYLQSLNSPERNCNISCRPKISSSWTFLLLKLTEVMSTQESYPHIFLGRCHLNVTNNNNIYIYNHNKNV